MNNKELKYVHRYVKGLSCQIIERTMIGFRVLETYMQKGKTIASEKVFGNMDFDPEVGCWIAMKAK